MSEFKPKVPDVVREIADSLFGHAKDHIIQKNEITIDVFLVNTSKHTFMHVDYDAGHETELEKDVMAAKVRMLAQAYECDYAITISEAWMSNNPNGKPSEDPQKEEILMLLVESKLGTWHSINKISRNMDGITIENNELVFAGLSSNRFSFIQQQRPRSPNHLH